MMPKSKVLTAVMSILALTVLLNACGTTRNFAVDSNPKGALLTAQAKPGTAFDLPKYCGETPVTAVIHFFSEGSSYCLTAEKRGYTQGSCVVNQNSNQAISFDLQRIEGVSEEVFRKANLPAGSYSLLPASVEVIVHSGVGAVDKREYSAEISNKVTEDLNAELIRTVNGSSKQIRGPILDETQMKTWRDLSPELNKYLSKLEAQRLPYYSLPPLINANIEPFSDLVGDYRNRAATEDPYLLYIWCKCVTETTGRQVGNVMLGLMGAAMQGYATASHTYFYYDPTAFNPDSGTLVLLYVIDAKTSEVLYIDQLVFPDITNADALKSMVASISTFPEVVMRKQ